MEDAIQRAALGKKRFQGPDGQPYRNTNRLLPPGNYTEWTAAENGTKRGVHRVLMAGDLAKPDAIYYWDHVTAIRIGP
jgi:guanyl-specific ribonuclease Sa